MSEITYTEDELQMLNYAGWVFLAPDYIYIPDDYDGCMASGHENIRRIIDGPPDHPQIGLRARWQNTVVLNQKISEFCKSSTIFAYERCYGLDIEAETRQFVIKCLEEFRGKNLFPWKLE
jgi:hypothetical protein